MYAQPSLLAIAQLKKLAKQAKKSRPDLTHAQLMDELAREHFPVRHYQELRKQVTTRLKAQYKPSDAGTVTCEFCGLLFVAEYPDDRAQHEKRHLAYEEALDGLGFLPADYDEREQAKRQASQEIREAQTAEEELVAVEKKIRAWFDRSLMASITNGYWKQHPSFEQYAGWAFHLAKPNLNLAHDLYLAKYGDTPGEIEMGKSYWYPHKILALHANQP